MTETTAPSDDAAAPAAPPSDHRGFGVDVGGSGIKGGIVDLESGLLIGERFKLLTPQPATPEAIADSVAEVVAHFAWEGPVGITLPAVIKNRIARSAANLDASWIGLDAHELFAAKLGREVSVLNDADAAGLAEVRFGEGAAGKGLVILLTFGTGIGSAAVHDGVLWPNTEFGHLEVNGLDAEDKAAASAKEREGLSWKRWAKDVSEYLSRLEALVSPDLFIAGGGISRKADKWIPLLTNKTPVVPATLLNTAGIVGAALAVDAQLHP